MLLSYVHSNDVREQFATDNSMAPVCTMDEMTVQLPTGVLCSIFASSDVVSDTTGHYERVDNDLVRTRTLHVAARMPHAMPALVFQGQLSKIGDRPIFVRKLLTYFLVPEARIIGDEFVQTDQDGDMRIYDRTCHVGYCSPFEWYAFKGSLIRAILLHMAVGGAVGMVSGLIMATPAIALIIYMLLFR